MVSKRSWYTDKLDPSTDWKSLASAFLESVQYRDLQPVGMQNGETGAEIARTWIGLKFAFEISLKIFLQMIGSAVLVHLAKGRGSPTC